MSGFLFVRWQPEFATGIDAIDAEHRRLVDMINELYQAMRAGQREAVVQDLFARLTEYVACHFSHEEELMRRHRYPELDEHRREHELLAQRVAELWRGGEQADLQMCMELFNFLRGWLNGHILQRDQLFVAHLTEAERTA